MTQPVDSSALIGYRLKSVQAALRRRMDSALRPLGLTSPQYACLELLQRTSGASSAELARAAFVTRQTMNTLLKGLAERGLVHRVDRASSGRALPAALAPEGRELLVRASEVVHDVERILVSPLTESQIEALGEALSRCANALEDE